ncbi:hypothetical protein JDY09_04275 [Thermoleophilum album]|uniref:hypothetical protein n=1 Tax=Thermoleophilum album TaxID=29539 RepID=UPI00237C9F96|nr:hypothetical protein [Thermoleophilum album]WDT94474.1 hypothetical protein JDY09_04275 [Thermoleophilum album]
MQATSRIEALRECRQCCAFCDRLVYPAGCVEAQCPYLYVYEEEASGRRYMGCLHKVFRGEIDVELFEEAERTSQGFGGMRLASHPLPFCRTGVERAYYGSGPAFECTNPDFWRDPVPLADERFDLRDRLDR